jgi:hypothetical protein
VSIIAHSDANSFYASVEMMRNPRLRDVPMAVCGLTEERHGILQLHDCGFRQVPAHLLRPRLRVFGQSADRSLTRPIIAPPE